MKVSIQVCQEHKNEEKSKQEETVQVSWKKKSNNFRTNKDKSL